MLLDDIAAILDDVAVMTKKAASKTAGVLGDDLALNAQQVSGVVSNRELPVVWAVAKGSFVNKLILVPAALAISAFAPWLITPLLIIGGLYLCFEGVEKLYHQWQHRGEKKTVEEAKAELKEGVSADEEKAKIKGAVRTDFILSAEIIAITLGVVADPAGPKPFGTQVAVLSAIAILMTVGVYGLVAGIVKLDDLGLHLSQKASAAAKSLGKAILWAAPFLMKGLSIAGTAAMFLVGGGIVTHGVPALHHWIEHIGHGPAGGLTASLVNGGIGLVAGAAVLLLVNGIKKMRGTPAH
jgi:predicted DNA repair protein MutK